MIKHGFVNVLYSLAPKTRALCASETIPNFLRQFQKDRVRDKTKPPPSLMDIAAIDIMRDRERGVPRYNRFRELVGKKRVTSFEEITSIPGIAEKMREIGQQDVDRVDLLVGLDTSEDLPISSPSAPLFRAFILMASRRLKSDRFFTDDFRPEIYTELGMDWIRNNSMKSAPLGRFRGSDRHSKASTTASHPGTS